MPQHDTIEITVGANPERLVTFANRLFVAVQSTPQVMIIDTDSNTPSGAIDVGGAPWWMAFVDIGTTAAPDPKLFVRDSNDFGITVLNLALLDVPATHIDADPMGGVPVSGGEMAASNRSAGVYLLDQLNTAAGARRADQPGGRTDRVGASATASRGIRRWIPGIRHAPGPLVDLRHRSHCLPGCDNEMACAIDSVRCHGDPARGSAVGHVFRRQGRRPAAGHRFRYRAGELGRRWHQPLGRGRR